MVDWLIHQGESRLAAFAAERAKSWTKWVEASFVRGASQAHRFSKARALQPADAARTGSQPHELVDDCLDDWATVWATHGCVKMELPPEAESWESLPAISHVEVRTAVRKFSARTAIGPGRMAPCSLWHLSD